MNAVAGRTILAKDQPNFTGLLQASSGTLQVNGDISTAQANVASQGTLEGIGIIGAATSSGTIAPGTTPIWDGVLAYSIGTLTIAGNYAGNGGKIAIDTVLGDDNSTTDLLIIQGNVTGTSSVQVTNIYGLGAQTVSDGIKIIQVDGNSPSGSFKLLEGQANGYLTTTGEQALIGGAYGYTLWHNGVTDPIDGNWYLRSQLRDTNNGGNVVLYQPLTPVAAAYPQALLNFMDMETYRQRAGGTLLATRPAGSNGTSSTVNSDGTQQETFFWARAKATRGHNVSERSLIGHETSFNSWVLRSGIDGLLYETADQTLIAGINILYGQSQTHVKSIYGNGSIDSKGYGVGGTLTWEGYQGFYLDAQTRATWFDSDLSSKVLGSLVNGNSGFGYAFSLEGGKKVDLGQGWSVTPQAQLTYANVDFDRFFDRHGAFVSLSDGDQLRARLGVSVDYDRVWNETPNDVRRLALYGIGNLYHDFYNTTRVNISQSYFAETQAKWLGGVGFGGSYEWGNGRYAMYGESDIKTNLSGHFGDDYAMSGRLGFKLKW